MRLKILIPPFLIVMILILAIGYIKPDFDVLQTKKVDIIAKETAVANVDTVVANIASLNDSLDTGQNFEKFAYRYLPDTQSQEQVIDTFNFLVAQSGMIITKMDLKQSQVVAAPVIVDESGVISDVSATPPLSVVKTFTFSGSVVGSYENIKAFFDRLAHMERFQKVNFFSIAAEKIDQSAEAPDTNRLVGTFEAEFGYLPAEPIASALIMPIFLRSKFDFSDVNKLLEQTANTVPTLEKGQTGKPNPFQ